MDALWRKCGMSRDTNTDGPTVRDVKLHFPPPADNHLIELGPKSATYKGTPGTDPAKWTEIVPPDLDSTVRNLTVSGVRLRDAKEDLPSDQVVKVIQQKLNPDYPKTAPKGGIGKAFVSAKAMIITPSFAPLPLKATLRVQS